MRKTVLRQMHRTMTRLFIVTVGLEDRSPGRLYYVARDTRDLVERCLYWVFAPPLENRFEGPRTVSRRVELETGISWATILTRAVQTSALGRASGAQVEVRWESYGMSEEVTNFIRQTDLPESGPLTHLPPTEVWVRRTLRRRA